jgi:hypothetical protein
MYCFNAEHRIIEYKVAVFNLLKYARLITTQILGLYDYSTNDVHTDTLNIYTNAGAQSHHSYTGISQTYFIVRQPIASLAAPYSFRYNPF